VSETGPRRPRDPVTPRFPSEKPVEQTTPEPSARQYQAETTEVGEGGIECVPLDELYGRTELGRNAFAHRGYTIEAQIACVRRELALRKRVYAKRVLERKMKPEEADHELACMQAVHDTLRALVTDQNSRSWVA
jgi:hypothetical protein